MLYYILSEVGGKQALAYFHTTDVYSIYVSTIYCRFALANIIWSIVNKSYYLQPIALRTLSSVFLATRLAFSAPALKISSTSDLCDI